MKRQTSGSGAKHGWLQIFERWKGIFRRLLSREAPSNSAPFKEYFCSKPFSWFEPYSDGNCYVCCPTWLPVSIGNWRETSPEEVWNSSTARKVRESILDGSFRYCSQTLCPNLSRAKIGNHRVVPKSQALKHPVWGDVIRQEKTQIDFPREFNASYDRACNLKCPSCRTDYIRNTDNEVMKLEAYIQKSLGTLDLLFVTGTGDPFASPSFFRLLSQIDGEKYPNLKVRLQTNGLLFTPANWEALKGIHSNIEVVQVSIDAASQDSYASNRGGSWDLLQQRLQFLSELPFRMEISMVVQENNFQEMAGFVKMAKKYGASSAHLTKLVNWGTYSDEEYRKRAVHLKGHPRHEEFLGVVQDKELQKAPANLMNLQEFVAP